MVLGIEATPSMIDAQVGLYPYQNPESSMGVPVNSQVPYQVPYEGGYTYEFAQRPFFNTSSLNGAKCEEQP